MICFGHVIFEPETWKTGLVLNRLRNRGKSNSIYTSQYTNDTCLRGSTGTFLVRTRNQLVSSWFLGNLVILYVLYCDGMLCDVSVGSFWGAAEWTSRGRWGAETLRTCWWGNTVFILYIYSDLVYKIYQQQHDPVNKMSPDVKCPLCGTIKGISNIIIIICTAQFQV